MLWGFEIYSNLCRFFATILLFIPTFLIDITNTAVEANDA